MVEFLSDVEILDIVETELNDTTRNAAMDMNEINATYVNLLKENNIPVFDNPRYHKQYLKQLILDNIPELHLSRPSHKAKPEQVLCTKMKDHMGYSAATADNFKEDLSISLKAAKMLRKNISSTPKWKFSGNLDDYELPSLLKFFCKHAIIGTGKIGHSNKEHSVDVTTSILAQHFMSAY